MYALHGREPKGESQRTNHLKALTQNFAERALGKLLAAELISDTDVVQVLSQEYSGFSVWPGEPFHDVSSETFVARYIERGPVSLEKLSIQDVIGRFAGNNVAASAADYCEDLIKSHRTRIGQTF